MAMAWLWTYITVAALIITARTPIEIRHVYDGMGGCMEGKGAAARFWRHASFWLLGFAVAVTLGAIWPALLLVKLCVLPFDIREWMRTSWGQHVMKLLILLCLLCLCASGCRRRIRSQPQPDRGKAPAPMKEKEPGDKKGKEPGEIIILGFPC